MLFTYPAIFYKEKEGGYSVVFPDLNHLATCGDSLEEAVYMAKDCLQGYLWSCLKDGDKFSDATDLEFVDPYCEDDEDKDDYVIDRFVRNITVDTDNVVVINDIES